jgi:DNA polymerase
MKLTNGAAEYLPEKKTLPSLREAVQQCRGCDLYRDATQAVFGEILVTPDKQRLLQLPVMMIGEQPGDREDKEGRPFVGPAGQLLDECLLKAGVERGHVYVTNAVKHFKWEARGKRRIHEKPTMREVNACRPWLNAELEVVNPALVVCLGATAAQSLLGASFRVTRERGKLIRTENLPPLMATVHPSSILRARTKEDRIQQKADFIADLRKVEEYLRQISDK